MIVYVFAIVFTRLGKETSLAANICKNVPTTMITFLLGGIVPDMERATMQFAAEHILFAVLFLLFVLLAFLTIMNMLIGVLVEVVNVVAAVEKETNQVAAVKNVLTKWAPEVDRDGNVRTFRKEDFYLLLKGGCAKELNEHGVDTIALIDYADFLYRNTETLSFSELLSTILALRGRNDTKVADLVQLRKFLHMDLQRLETLVEAVRRQVAGGRSTRSAALQSGSDDRPSESQRQVTVFLEDVRPSGTGALCSREREAGKQAVVSINRSDSSASRRIHGHSATLSFNTPKTGAGTGYLAKVKSGIPVVPRPKEDSEPAFNDTIEKFRESVADKKTIERLRNKVKVCGKCGKPCAISLKICNACGASLAGIDVSYNDNIFMAFVHGIAKGRFPYIISLRYQDQSMLCFDDPLSMSPLHLNVIPTDTYIPDWRFLFLNPTKGLNLVDEMFETAAKVALDQFWSNEAFRTKVLGGEAAPKTLQEVMDVTCCGMNFPPSMYQLHLQFIHSPLTPFHYNQAKRGDHWHHGRFFPLEYVRKALELGNKVKMNITEDTDIEYIMRKLEEHGVVYDSVHRKFSLKCWNLQQRFQAWSEDDFECQVINNRVYNMVSGNME